MNPDVTVLMAVYNAESFLRESLDSLLAQTIADRLQVVCVDDASTDGSLSILQHYAAEHPQIEVMRQTKNLGQAVARNVALSKARGKYVCMLDADDTYAPDALAEAVSQMEADEQIDCVLFDVSMDWSDHSHLYPLPDFVTLSGEEAFRLSLTWQIHGVYMVRSAIHFAYPYDTTCRLYSDDNTTRMHYLTSRKVGRCRGVYHYRQHSGSATHQVSVRRFDYLRANESMKRQMTDAQVSADLLAIYENHRWLNLVGVYMFYHVHGRELDASARRYGLSELHRVWQTIDRSQLSPRLRRKFGYCPMPTWQLFRLQEWCYFTLRGFFRKNY